jgi:nucleoid DNA-binding protein
VTKAQLVERLAAETGLTRLEIRAVVDGMAVLITDRVAAGETVEVRGFGTFRPRDLPARQMPDPRTGKVVDVPPRTVPVFRPADAFRQAVEEGSRRR